MTQYSNRFAMRNSATFLSRRCCFRDRPIGYDLLKRFIVDVDDQEGRFRLHPPGAKTKDLGPKPVILPTKVKGTSLYVHADIRMAGSDEIVRTEPHLDTGANGKRLGVDRAGIKGGDIIVSIKDRPTYEAAREGITDILSGKGKDDLLNVYLATNTNKGKCVQVPLTAPL